MAPGGKRHNAGRKTDPNSVRSRRKARQQAKQQSATVLQHPSVPPQAHALRVEPTVALDEADAPNDLTLDERHVWLEFAPIAMKNGRLGEATAAAFKNYCRWVKLERDCSASVIDRGSSTHDRAMKWAARFYEEFSLTPGGRAVVEPSAQVRDEDEEFFGVTGSR